MKLIKIGRTEGNDLVIKDDTTISRNHAEIFQDDEGNIFLTDLNSSNGTFVNGNKFFPFIKYLPKSDDKGKSTLKDLHPISTHLS